MCESDPITEIIREYSGVDTATGSFINYPTVSSRFGDFAQDNQQQQTSTNYSTRRNMHEFDLHI